MPIRRGLSDLFGARQAARARAALSDPAVRGDRGARGRRPQVDQLASRTRCFSCGAPRATSSSRCRSSVVGASPIGRISFGTERTGTWRYFSKPARALALCQARQLSYAGVQASERAQEPTHRHSAKPPEMREVLESMYPQLGPDNRLELFARGEVPGWSTWGNRHDRVELLP